MEEYERRREGERGGMEGEIVGEKGKKGNQDRTIHDDPIEAVTNKKEISLQ